MVSSDIRRYRPRPFRRPALLRLFQLHGYCEVDAQGCNVHRRPEDSRRRRASCSRYSFRFVLRWRIMLRRQQQNADFGAVDDMACRHRFASSAATPLAASSRQRVLLAAFLAMRTSYRLPSKEDLFFFLRRRSFLGLAISMGTPFTASCIFSSHYCTLVASAHLWPSPCVRLTTYRPLASHERLMRALNSRAEDCRALFVGSISGR